ncbi:hypothetical protein TgHK011_007702 [Trichoderma gracile]|nr:hypothetical protein TgHK011_007702 [Trichoderma gracile]
MFECFASTLENSNHSKFQGLHSHLLSQESIPSMITLPLEALYFLPSTALMMATNAQNCLSVITASSGTGSKNSSKPPS